MTPLLGGKYTQHYNNYYQRVSTIEILFRLSFLYSQEGWNKALRNKKGGLNWRMYFVKSWLSPEAEEECAMCGLANHHNTKSLITGCQKKVNLETVPVLSCAISRLNLHDSIISCWEYSADPPRSAGDPTQSHHTSRGQDGGLQSPRLSSLRAPGGCPHISHILHLTELIK